MSYSIRRGLSLGGLALTSLALAATAQSELIISEYVEGSSYNKALELFNNSSQAADLSQYRIQLFSNGKTTPTATLTLSGSLAAGQTYVITNSRSTADLLNKADTTHGVTNFNGNDVLQLQSSGGQVIDVLGNLGDDSHYGQDKTLARLASALSPSTTFSASSWQTLAKDDFSGIGVAPAKTPGNGTGYTDCGAKSSRISSIQGTGSSSTVVGSSQIVQGVVTRVLYKSYYLQQEVSAEDQQGASRAVKVYDPVNTPSVGDEVYIQGTVAEYYNQTQLQDINSNYKLCASGQMVTPLDVSMPSDGNFEAYEGMLVNLNPMSGDTGLFVSEIYNLNRFGDMMVSSGSNRVKPTNLYPAGSSEAQQLQAYNDANKIIIGDGDGRQYLPQVGYLTSLSFNQPARVGSQVTSGLSGIISEAYGDYRLLPTDQITLDNNVVKRPEKPVAPKAGELRLTSFNVLNYFNGLPEADGTIDWSRSNLGSSRGANSQAEFDRQTSKIVSALMAINADIIGLVEIENDGWDDQSAVADLVKAMNNSAERPRGKRYAYARTTEAFVGSDVIKVALVYNKRAVKPVGDMVALTQYPFDETTAKHRPPVIQTFKEKASGKKLTVVVNHFKSKGSSCSSLQDPEDNAGQGNCNRLRVAAAESLGQYLNTHYDRKRVMILGDLNAYAQEDPMLVLTRNGTQKAIETIQRDDSGQYSVASSSFELGYTDLLLTESGSPATYVFKGESGMLDYALASQKLKRKVTRAFVWPVNAFELPGLDYNDEFYRSRSGSKVELKTIPDSERQWFDKLVDASSPYRSSDHDPVVVDVKLSGKVR